MMSLRLADGPTLSILLTLAPLPLPSPLHFRIAPPQRFLVGMEEFYIKAVTSDGVQIVREPEPAPSGPFIDEDNGEEIAVDHA